MGRGKKNHRIRRQGSFEIDLLATTFGLPSRRMIQRAEEKTPKFVVTYTQPGNDDDDDDGGTDSSFSCFEEDDEVSEVSEVEVVKTPSPLPKSKSRSSIFRLRRPKKKHPPKTPSPPTPPRKARLSSSSKRAPRRVSPRISPRSSTKSSPRSSEPSSTRSTSSGESPSRSARARAPSTPVASFVQPSASLSQYLPVQYLSGTTSVSTASPNFFDSSASQSGTLPVQPQYYYQPQLAYVQPAPAQTAMPQGMAMPPAPSVFMQTAPAPQQTPSVHHVPPHNQEVPGWAASSGPFAQDLQRIQKDIDLKMAYLAHHPDNLLLRSEVRRLQDLLNLTLNAAIAKQDSMKECTTPDRSFEYTQQARAPLTPYDEKPQSPIIPATQKDELEERSKLPPPQGSLRQQSIPVETRTEAARPSVNRHLCSGCGCVRSDKFEEKHPFSLQPKPIVNFCEICRDKKIRRGVTGRYHFCFDCGQVRSKNFHREHPILPGDPILENYCGPCVKEVRPDESIVDASVLCVVCHYHIHVGKCANIV